MLNIIVILALLVAPYLFVKVSKRPWDLAGSLGLTLVFFFTGVGHFLKTEAMALMIPESIPGRVTIIYMTGVLEIGLACLLFSRKYRRKAGLAVLIMLASFLPFNVYAAFARVPMGGHSWGPVYLLIRVPVQLFLMAWTYRFVLSWEGSGHSQPGYLKGSP